MPDNRVRSMPSFLSEHAIGLLIQHRAVTAVEIRAGFSLHRPVFQVMRCVRREMDAGWTTGDQWLEVLREFPVSIPVIPVIQFPVLLTAGPKGIDDARADILKPLIRAGGTVWIAPDGRAGVTDTGYEQVVRTLSAAGRQIPGIVHPEHAIRALIRPDGSGTAAGSIWDSCAVLADPPRYTIVFPGHNAAALCRTFQAPPDTAAEILKTTFHTVTQENAGRALRAVHWFGPKPCSRFADALEGLNPPLPWVPPPSRFTVAGGITASGSPESGSNAWAVAAGAVACWMETLRPPMMHPPGSGRRNTHLFRRSRSRLKWAVLIFLLALNLWFGLGLVRKTMEIRELDHAAAEQMATRPQADPLPELLQQPAAGIRFRNHRYLGPLSDMSRSAGVILDDVDIRMPRIRLQGHADRMEPIGAFVRSIRSCFDPAVPASAVDPSTASGLLPEDRPVVQPPVTARDAAGRMVFTLDIEWTNH